MDIGHLASTRETNVPGASGPEAQPRCQRCMRDPCRLATSWFPGNHPASHTTPLAAMRFIFSRRLLIWKEIRSATVYVGIGQASALNGGWGSQCSMSTLLG